MARSVLALSIIQDGPEPDRNGPRRLEVVKTNLCRYPEALGVWFEDGHSSHELDELNEGGKGKGSHELHELHERGKAGGRHSVPVVRYGEAPEAYREPTQAEACADWLVEVLEEAGEPMKPKEVVEMGKEAGFKQA